MKKRKLEIVPEVMKQIQALAKEKGVDPNRMLAHVLAQMKDEIEKEDKKGESD